ncbi:flagella biosynthesis regulatory protein FliT [Chimaeribacter californicus]|uniref:Flagellar protein FliT n=1 Tax=Chimaeribacter californicus TaxID=2060067 RepID=A0A2N5E735_9GAMM|nr:flagella biosynthesis regulatory protein FliT [Chimaeribacter californicus]PLR37287.1 flagella biosynthesis regulatory protein FliT [Chimaeribacter californicus]
MDRHPHLVTAYQQILSLSEQMLALAHQEQWQELVELEISYAKAVESTAALPVNDGVPEQVQETIRSMLTRILDNESQVKQLLNARMGKLAELIGNTGRKKDLHHAYGKFDGQYTMLQGDPQ